MTPHDEARRDRAIRYKQKRDRAEFNSLEEQRRDLVAAVGGLQSTDDPSLVPLYDELSDRLTAFDREYPQILEKQLTKIRNAFEKGKLQILPNPPTITRFKSPYYFRREVDGLAEEYGFATLEEMTAFLKDYEDGRYLRQKES